MKIPLPLLVARTGTKRKRFVIGNPEPRDMDRVRLLRVYMQVVNHWAGMRAKLLAEYERTLQAAQANDGYEARGIKGVRAADSAEDINSTLEEGTSWFNRLVITLEAGITSWALGVEAWQRGKWRGAVLSATGVDLDTMLYAGDVTETVQSRILANLELIKDVNAQQRQRMAQVVFNGLNQRLPARDVAKQLAEVTGFGRKRALLIASVELQKIATALSVERSHQAGVGNKYEWVHSRKKHPRDWHKARNGKTFSDKAKPGSEEYVPPDDRPGIPIRCGCRRLPVLDLSEYDDDILEEFA